MMCLPYCWWYDILLKNVMTLYFDVMTDCPSFFLPHDVFLFNVLFNVFDVLYGFITYFLMTFWWHNDVLQSRITSWHHDLLFDVMTYLLMSRSTYRFTSWRFSHTFWHHDALFDVMTYFLTFMTCILTLFHTFLISWHTFHTFWYHDILSILWHIRILWYILTSLRTFHIFRLCHDILRIMPR